MTSGFLQLESTLFTSFCFKKQYLMIIMCHFMFFVKDHIFHMQCHCVPKEETKI
jgi:hypothetical protein